MTASISSEEVFYKMRRILDRLAVIEKQQPQVLKHLRAYLENRIDNTVHQLEAYLSSSNVKASFTSWSSDEVPEAESTWQVTENHIRKVQESRLQEFIQQWEEDNRVFGNARESLLQHFQLRYNFVEEQLRNLQSAVISDDLDAPENDPSVGDWTTTQKALVGVTIGVTVGVAIAATSPIWVPHYLATLAVSAPIYGAKALYDKVGDIRKIKKYEEDKCAFMAEISADYFAESIEEEKLREYVQDQFKEAVVCLKQIEARLPELIQADKLLYQQLTDETRSKKEIQDLYQPIVDEGSKLRGQLAVFGISEVRAVDISTEVLEWKEDSSSQLGRGAIGAVYQGTMRTHGEVQTVALKVCNEVLQAKNASKIMAEVELLR